MTKCLFYTIEIWGEKAPFSMNSDQRNMITMYLWQKGFLFYFCFNNDLKCACVTHTQARLMLQTFKKKKIKLLCSAIQKVQELY